MTDTVKKSFILNKPNIGLHIPTGIWRVRNFSSGAICLVLGCIYGGRLYKRF
jgi:hypothetical protein